MPNDSQTQNARKDQSTASSGYPEPPPISVAGLFLPLGPMAKRIRDARRPMREPLQAAIRMYFDSVRLRGKPYPGWEKFERELAFQFALLLNFLAALPRRKQRLQLLELFLDHLDLQNKPGRARKARQELMDYRHGRCMEELWTTEVCGAWRIKANLEKRARDARAYLQGEHYSLEVINAILSPKASPQSALAKIYAHRSGGDVSEGTARNALRAYEKFMGWKIIPPHPEAVYPHK